MTFFLQQGEVSTKSGGAWACLAYISERKGRRGGSPNNQNPLNFLLSLPPSLPPSKFSTTFITVLTNVWVWMGGNREGGDTGSDVLIWTMPSKHYWKECFQTADKVCIIYELIDGGELFDKYCKRIPFYCVAFYYYLQAASKTTIPVKRVRDLAVEPTWASSPTWYPQLSFSWLGGGCF